MNTLLEVADRWLVRGLDPLTLASQGEMPLPGRLGQLTFATDGRTAYALAGAGSVLLRLDPAAGTATPLAALPGRAISLAVAGDRIYVPHPYGNEVWALDRRTGRLVRTIPVGRGPAGITLGAA
jgi:DNA-binding beta-propeller fold protein YncE